MSDETNDLILNAALNGTTYQQEDEDDPSDAFTPDEVLEAKRWETKPNISWLQPAVLDGKFLPVKGGYLIMERNNLLLNTPTWLDTKVYRLLTDPDLDGNARLFDCSNQNNALFNWKSAVGLGFELKLPPPGRNPELLFESTGKRRRKRKFVETQVAKEDNELAQQPKRKRGRPKGSKNKKTTAV